MNKIENIFLLLFLCSHVIIAQHLVPAPKVFMEFCENIVRSYYRVPICWNLGLPPSNTITRICYSYIGEKLNKEEYTNPYPDSFQGYMNGENPILNTARYFVHQACNQEEATEKARGGILCLWNDVRVENKELLFAYNVIPNGLLAFSESFWCGGKRVETEKESLLPFQSMWIRMGMSLKLEL